MKFLRSIELRYSNMAALNRCIFRSSTGPKILAFGSHFSVNFQQILDCFIPNFKLKYDDSENIKADRVSTVTFNLNQIKRRAVFGTPGTYDKHFNHSYFSRRSQTWVILVISIFMLFTYLSIIIYFIFHILSPVFPRAYRD